MPWLSDYDLWKTTPPWFYDEDPPEIDEPEATDLDAMEDLEARTGILAAATATQPKGRE